MTTPVFLTELSGLLNIGIFLHPVRNILDI